MSRYCCACLDWRQLAMDVAGLLDVLRAGNVGKSREKVMRDMNRDKRRCGTHRMRSTNPRNVRYPQPSA